MENKKVRAVGYARVSTKNQLIGREFDSIDTQKAIIVYYAKPIPKLSLCKYSATLGGRVKT